MTAVVSSHATYHRVPEEPETPARVRGSYASQIGGLFPLSRAKTPYLPTYCGRQPPGSVPHLPTYSQAAQRSEKIPVSR